MPTDDDKKIVFGDVHVSNAAHVTIQQAGRDINDTSINSTKEEELSNQAISILQQIESVEARYIRGYSSGRTGVREMLYELLGCRNNSGDNSLKVSDPRFLNDDMQCLVSQGFIVPEPNHPENTSHYRVTRKVSNYVANIKPSFQQPNLSKQAVSILQRAVESPSPSFPISSTLDEYIKLGLDGVEITEPKLLKPDLNTLVSLGFLMKEGNTYTITRQAVEYIANVKKNLDS